MKRNPWTYPLLWLVAFIQRRGWIVAAVLLLLWLLPSLIAVTFKLLGWLYQALFNVAGSSGRAFAEGIGKFFGTVMDSLSKFTWLRWLLSFLLMLWRPAFGWIAFAWLLVDTIKGKPETIETKPTGKP